MSLSAEGIAGMLAEYTAGHNMMFDEVFVGQMPRCLPDVGFPCRVFVGVRRAGKWLLHSHE